MRKSICALLIALTGSSSVIAQEFTDALLDYQGYPMDDPLYEDIRTWFEEEEKGLSLYRSKAYEDAYPHLAEAARHGFKRAQLNLALMHLNGHGVEKNPLIGVALLGLAAESGERSVKKDYKNALKMLPKKYQPLVEQQADYYIARYGMKVQGVSCRRVKKPGSNLKEMRCVKEPGEYQTWDWAP